MLIGRSRRLGRIGVIVSALLLAAPIAGAQQNDVVARVNGVDITSQDYAIAAQMYGQQLGEMPDDAKKSMIVDALIEARLMSDAARKSGIADDDEFKRQIAFFEAQTLRSIFLEREVSKRVDDKAVRKAYDDQVATMPKVEETRLRHILLPTIEAATAAIAELNSGKDFGIVAKEQSADPASKDNGGDLGFSASGQTLSEIESAASKLQPGQFASSPVKSAFGYHVVKVDERRTRPAPPFASLAGEIKQALLADEARRIGNELRASAKVEKLVPDVRPPESDDGHSH